MRASVPIRWKWLVNGLVLWGVAALFWYLPSVEQAKTPGEKSLGVAALGMLAFYVICFVVPAGLIYIIATVIEYFIQKKRVAKQASIATE